MPAPTETPPAAPTETPPAAVADDPGPKSIEPAGDAMLDELAGLILAAGRAETEPAARRLATLLADSVRRGSVTLDECRTAIRRAPRGSGLLGGPA